MVTETPNDCPGSGDQQLQKQPAKAVRVSREKITQTEIDEINELHDEIVSDAHKIADKIITMGGKLIGAKARLRHGQWGKWVERNLRFHIRTATKYMRAYERRHERLVSEDPTLFLSQIYGNEPKQIEDKTDVQETKSAVDGRNDNAHEECYDPDEDLPSSRPAKISPEEWSGMQLVKELGKTLDVYLNQPIAETLKLQVLISCLPHPSRSPRATS